MALTARDTKWEIEPVGDFRDRIGGGGGGAIYQTKSDTASYTGISGHIRTKLRDWAVGQARAGCYSQAALSSNDSKTL